MNSDTLYAVAVRDEAESFIVLNLCRRSDNIYYNLPRDHDPDWKPHGSFHASGQRHHKSFNHKMGIAYGQKPNKDFKGTENMVTFGIASDEPRKINLPCQASNFQEVFEIPLSDLRTERYRTCVSVDITERGVAPYVQQPDAKILGRTTFKDSVPWIVVTLFELPDNPLFARQREQTQVAADDFSKQSLLWP